MSRDVLTVGSTIRIPLLYRGEYSQWVERFMNYLEEQNDGEPMINCIKHGDQPLPRVTQVSIAGTSSTEQPHLKDKSMWSDQDKKIQNIDRLARSLLIQGLLNDIYSLIDSNKSAKDLWDALARHMLGLEYGKQDRKAAVLYEYETFKATEGELLLDTYKVETVCNNDETEQEINGNQPLIAKKTKVSKRKEKVVVSLDSEGKYVKSDDKKVEKKDDEKKRYMSKLKCYNCKKEGHFAKDCKKAKVKDYEYYKTKMLLAKKDKDEQVLLAEDHAWIESSKIFHDGENFPENPIESQIDHNESTVDHNDFEGIDKLIKKFNKKIAKCLKCIEKANQQKKDFENQNKDLQDKYDVLKNQATTFKMKNNELNEQMKVLIENNDDLLAQTNVLKDQLQVKHVVIDTHVECQEKYAKLKAERYEYMIRYSA
nr:hypothetical protein [Tanacetum cinerariifolium]